MLRKTVPTKAPLETDLPFKGCSAQELHVTICHYVAFLFSLALSVGQTACHYKNMGSITADIGDARKAATKNWAHGIAKIVAETGAVHRC
jgi:hypothetical protein